MNNVELLQKLTQEQRENMTALTADLVKQFQAIALAHSEFSQKALQDAAAFFEKLTSVKSFDKALEVQAEYKQAASETFAEQSKKVAEIYTNLARNAFKPMEPFFAKPPAST